MHKFSIIVTTLCSRCYHLHFSYRETEFPEVTEDFPETQISYILKTMYCKDVLLKVVMKNGLCEFKANVLKYYSISTTKYSTCHIAIPQKWSLHCH